MTPSGHGGNPAGTGRDHYAAQQSPPDLDAGAPSLRAEDAQRLDRRGVLLLAVVVLLLLVAIAVLLRMMGKDEAVGAGREESVVIPELPRIAAPPASGSPARARGPAPVEPLPVVSLPAPPLRLPPSPERPRAVPDSGPSLVDRRSGGGDSTPPRDAYMQAMLAGLPGAEAPPPPAPAQAATSARPLLRPDTLLVRGTHIRCVLETRIVTDVPGHASCIVTEPVYSINGRRLLLPGGSRVLGRYDGEPAGPRVAVVWDRITTPTGIDIGMASPGVDGLGGAGHPGHYSAHWGPRIGSALLVSLIGDAFKYAAAEAGPSGTVVGGGGVVVHSPYESATARTLERLAGQALATRRAPTVTIPQGTLLNVHVARDVDFSAVVAQL